MPNNCLSVLYKHIIQVENKNVGLKLGGTNIPLPPPNKKSGGPIPPIPPPPPLPLAVLRVQSECDDLQRIRQTKHQVFPSM